MSKVRVSAVISNAPYLLNVDCDHYINNSKALREAMCFMMDPSLGKRVCYVQFPQRFDGIDRHDRYSNRNIVFFDVCIPFSFFFFPSLLFLLSLGKLIFQMKQINMRGLDGIQGPIYVGTGCVFRRQALYGYDAPVKKKPPGKTCNCPRCCCLCCGSRKGKKVKQRDQKKKKMKHRESSNQIYALETIQGGIKGVDLLSKTICHFALCRIAFCKSRSG